MPRTDDFAVPVLLATWLGSIIGITAYLHPWSPDPTAWKQFELGPFIAWLTMIAAIPTFLAACAFALERQSPTPRPARRRASVTALAITIPLVAAILIWQMYA